MITWPKISTVLLDLDGTLLDLRFDNYFWLEFLPQRYAQHHRMQEADARHLLYGHFERLRGSLEWYCLDFWSRELQLDVTQLKHELAHLIALRPETIQFLQALQHAGKRVVLATNGHRAGLDLKLATTGIAEYFDAIYSAHDFGFPKEAQAFWQQLQAQAQFENNSSLFIDDNEQVLAAAAEFGIQHLLSIHQPDSGLDGKSHSQFRLLRRFAEILPIQ